MENVRKNKNNWCFLAVLMLTVLAQFTLLASPANALIYWANKNGSASFFDWQNGGSDKGLFGDPMLIGGNTLVFFPSNFRAESSNGIPSIKSDRLEVDLLAHPGYNITDIIITEYGDYGILTEGKVSVSGSMFVTNLNVYEVHSGNFTSTPTSPITSGMGDWSAQVGVTDIEWTHLKIVLNNNLMAISKPGSMSYIEKKIMGGAVAIELIGEPPIPEPATISLLAVGSLIFIGRKK